MQYYSMGMQAVQAAQSAQNAKNANEYNSQMEAYRGQQAAYRDQEMAASEQAIKDQLATQTAEAEAQDAADAAKEQSLLEQRAADEAALARDAAAKRAALRARMAASGVSPDSGSALVTLRNLLEESETKNVEAETALDEDLDALGRMKAARARRLALQKKQAETSAAQLRARRQSNLLAPPYPAQQKSFRETLPAPRFLNWAKTSDEE